MKLNLGCGHNKLDGYCNVDVVSDYSPDAVVDLEKFPWPWKDSTVDEIALCHVLEHLGESRDIYLGVWKEMYRVLKPNGRVHITVPHWLHENFAHDPTHVRKVTPAGVCMFDNARNQEDFARDGRETKLGWLLGIDFSLVNVGYDLAGEAQMALARGEFSEAQAAAQVNRIPNFCEQIQIIVQAIKPPRGRL